MIAIVFSFITILIHKNKRFCFGVSQVLSKEGILAFSVLKLLSTFNVGS